MKVRELIEELKKHDPELEVLVNDGNNVGWVRASTSEVLGNVWVNGRSFVNGVDLNERAGRLPGGVLIE